MHDFQRLCPTKNINVQCDAIQTLDLATAFKGLQLITFEDKPATPEKEIADVPPFEYSSSFSSPTTSEEAAQNTSEIDIADIPASVENTAWAPPLHRGYLKRPYSSQIDLSPPHPDCTRCKRYR